MSKNSMRCLRDKDYYSPLPAMYLPKPVRCDACGAKRIIHLCLRCTYPNRFDAMTAALSSKIMVVV